MDLELIRHFFAWCSVINIGIFLYWAIFLLLAPNWVYQYSSKWVAVSEDQFKSIHFALLGGFKLTIIFFNLVPYLVLRIIG